MNDDFVGLDLELCYKQFDEWRIATDTVFKDLQKVIYIFNETLRLNWYSPVAKQKSNDFKRIFNNIRIELERMFNTIYKNAVGAVRILAIKNGVSLNSVNEKGWAYFDHYNDDGWIDLEEEGPKGVGMNKSRVKNTILPDLNTGINGVMDSLDNLPMDLAVYDERGNILETYQTLIKNCKEYVKQCLEEANKQITSVIDTEIDNITLGVVESVNTMTA